MCSHQLQPLDHKNRSIITIRMIQSSTWMRSIPTWQSGWWEWQAAQRGAASAPPWQPSDFGQLEQLHYDKPHDLRELLDQARQARVSGHILVQSVAPMLLLFASVRDLDGQRQQHHDQTLAKHQSSPLNREQCKWG